MKIWRFELKRRENTVWDYVVPLSLVGLALIVMWYADLYPLNQFLYMGVIDIFVIIVLTTFFTRIQRLLIYFFVPVISFAFEIGRASCRERV